MNERDPNLEMSPRAFAIGMSALAIYFAGAFYLTFFSMTYSPNFALRSAKLIRDPIPAVQIEISFKDPPSGGIEDAEINIWGDAGPPYHFQEKLVPPGEPGTTQVFVVPLDAENESRLRGGRGPFKTSFRWGYSRSVKIDVKE